MTDMPGGENLAKLVKNLVYEKGQTHSRSLDLTVRSISRIATTGNIDFGGGEYAPGERITLEPKKMDPSAEYGWWHLPAGDFLVEYNEELSEELFALANSLAILQPHERLLECGATHAARFITEPEERLFSLIHVCQADIRIKENARVSKLIVLRFE